MNRRYLLTLLLIVGLAAGLYFVGVKQKWWSADTPDTPDAADNEPTADPEPGDPPIPPVVITTTSTNNIPGTKETPLDPSKPAPKTGFAAKEEAIKLARLLADPLDATGSDIKAFKIILAYSANELRAVCNSWVKTYPKGGGGGIKPTLREMVKAEVVWSFRTEGVQLKKDVINRLDNLKIP